MNRCGNRLRTVTNLDVNAITVRGRFGDPVQIRDADFAGIQFLRRSDNDLVGCRPHAEHEERSTAAAAEAGRPLRGPRVLARLATSWMSRELLAGAAFAVLGAAEFVVPGPAPRLLAALPPKRHPRS